MVPGSENITQGQDFERLIDRLRDRNDKDCKQARKLLVEIGHRAVPTLINALRYRSNENVRWEAVEALAQIADPTAAPALVQALMDDSQDVRGAAARTLIILDRAAITPLLEALTKQFNSVWLRNGAHHILHVLKQRGRLNTGELRVFEALEDIAPEIEVPWAAAYVLNVL
jgi:HEAT repeat protein